MFVQQNQIQLHRLVNCLVNCLALKARNLVFLAVWPTANTDSCKMVCQINCVIFSTLSYYENHS